MFILVLAVTVVACDTVSVPTDEEVESAYAKALEAYQWLDLTTMPFAGEPVEQDGRFYFVVNHQTIKTRADLEAYLQDLFSDEVTKKILSMIEFSYIDIDGKLHTLPADRGTDLYAGEETHKIIKVDNSKIIYQVTVEVLDEDLETVIDEKVYSFNYEFVGDKWVFTNFNLVR